MRQDRQSRRYQTRTTKYAYYIWIIIKEHFSTKFKFQVKSLLQWCSYTPLSLVTCVVNSSDEVTFTPAEYIPARALLTGSRYCSLRSPGSSSSATAQHRDVMAVLLMACLHEAMVAAIGRATDRRDRSRDRSPRRSPRVNTP